MPCEMLVLPGTEIRSGQICLDLYGEYNNVLSWNAYIFMTQAPMCSALICEVDNHTGGIFSF